MEQNDMRYIMVNIILYFYDCMKNEKYPKFDDFSPETLGINNAYWIQIMDELIDHKFLKGVEKKHAAACRENPEIGAFRFGNAYVSLDGLEFYYDWIEKHTLHVNKM